MPPSTPVGMRRSAFATQALVLLCTIALPNALLSAVRAASGDGAAALRINEPNILLPVSAANRSVGFLLHATGADCFTWESASSDVAAVTVWHDALEAPCPGVPPDEPAHSFDADAAGGEDFGSDPSGAGKSGSGRGGTSGSSAGGACSPKAIVTAGTTGGEERAQATVFATSVDDSDVSLRCDVWVAAIAALDISTVVERLTVGDQYTVMVTAKDAHENTFSTLEGLRFRWETSNGDVLHIAKLGHSRKSLSEPRRLVERDAFSDAVVLHGRSTGRVNITVKLQEAGYEDLASTTKELKVVELPELVPDKPQYLAPGTLLPYKLRRRVNLRPQPIDMPHDFFRWRSSVENVATVDNRMGLLAAVALGSSRLTVYDLRLEDDISTSAMVHVVDPESLDMTIRPVVDDKDIEKDAEQRASASGKWHLVHGTQYSLWIEMRDEKLRVMFNGPNVRFHVSLDEDGTGERLELVLGADGLPLEGVEVLPPGEASGGTSKSGSPTLLGSHFHVLAAELGEVTISARLHRIENPETGAFWAPPKGRPLFVSETAIILPPVQIVAPPPPIVLAHDFVGHQRHRAHLVVKGGSGKYSYTSGDSSVYTVSPHGVVSTVSPGNGPVVAADVVNSFSRDSAEVVVARPQSLHFLPSFVEVPLGSFLRLFVGAVPENSAAPYFNCSALGRSMVWEVRDPLLRRRDPFRIDDASLPSASAAQESHFRDTWTEPVCGDAEWVAERVGFTTVRVVYGPLKATVKVSVYPPVKLLHPTVPALQPLADGGDVWFDADADGVDDKNDDNVSEDCQAVVSLGSELPVVIEGGPTAWAVRSHAGASSQVVDAVVPRDDATSIRVDRVYMGNSAHRYGYTLTCTRHNEQVVDFLLGNPSIEDGGAIAVPVVERVSIAFSCSPPDRVHLRLPSEDLLRFNTSVAHAEPMFGPDSYIVQTNQRLSVLLDAFDAHQPLPRRFNNFSTADVEWSLTDTTLAGLLEQGDSDELTAHDVILAFTTIDANGEDLTSVVPTPGRGEGWGGKAVGWGWAGSREQPVQTFDQNGVVLVKSSIRQYILAMLQAARVLADAQKEVASGLSPPVEHSLRLNIVDHVVLVPPTAVMFNHPSNVMRVTAVGGSGRNNFTVDNETVVTWTVDPTNTFVELVPRHPGKVRITCEDTGLEGGYIAHSYVLVSDAHRVALRVRDQIPLGATVPLAVTVYDADDNIFPEEQYELMGLAFDYDDSVLSVDRVEHPGDDIEDPADERPDDADWFTLTGMSLGQSLLTATVHHPAPRRLRTEISANGAINSASSQRSREVASEPVLVHVFPPLRFRPSFLSLLPGSTFTPQLEGGPHSGPKVSFVSENTTVASIAHVGPVITAHHLGKTLITASVHGVDSTTGHGTVLASACMTVEVALPQGLDIFVPTSRVLVGERLKLTVRSFKGQSPFSFGVARDAVQFSWEVDDAEVVELVPQRDEIEGPAVDRDGSPLYSTGFSSWVLARSVGTTTVRIRTVIDVGDYGTLLLEDTQSLTSVLRLKLLTPERMRLPPGVSARIRTNMDHTSLKYALLTEPGRSPGVVSVDTYGRLTAAGAPGSSIVSIRDELNEQWATVTIEVNAIAQISLVPVPPYFATVPIGATAHLHVQLRDDLGRLFYLGSDVTLSLGDHGGTSDSNPVSAEQHHVLQTGFGDIEVFSNDEHVAGDLRVGSNGTVTIRGKREGAAVVKIWMPRALSGRSWNSSAEDRSWPLDEIMAGSEINKGRCLACQRHADGMDTRGDEKTVAEIARRAPGMLVDYVAVRVVNILEPMSPVVVAAGGTVQFNAYVPAGDMRADELRAGAATLGIVLWRSADPTIVRIDPVTGEAFALRPGKTTVYFDASAAASVDGLVPGDGDELLDESPTHATVIVTRVGAVHLAHLDVHGRALPVPSLTSTPPDSIGAESLRLRVHIEDSRTPPGQLDRPTSHLIQHRTQFSCFTEDGAWIEVWAVGPGAINDASEIPKHVLTEAKTSGHAAGEIDESRRWCVIVPRSPSEIASELGSPAAQRPPLVSEVSVQATAQAHGGEVGVHSAPLVVPFQPAFVVVAGVRALPVDENGCYSLSRVNVSTSFTLYGDAAQVGVSVRGHGEEGLIADLERHTVPVGREHRASPSADLAVKLALKRRAAPASRPGGGSPSSNMGTELPPAFSNVEVLLENEATGQQHYMCFSFDDGRRVAGPPPDWAWYIIGLLGAIAALIVLLIVTRLPCCSRGSAGYAGGHGYDDAPRRRSADRREALRGGGGGGGAASDGEADSGRVDAAATPHRGRRTIVRSSTPSRFHRLSGGEPGTPAPLDASSAYVSRAGGGYSGRRDVVW